MGFKRDLVNRYLKKYTNTPTLTLAKLIYKENPEAFLNAEGVRDIIRYSRGAQGDKRRARLADKTFTDFEGQYNPFDKLPEGLTYYEQWEHYQVEGENVLILADLHIPYHVKDPLQTMMKYGKDRKVDTVLLLGDFADFYSVSFWEKDPTKRRWSYELQQIRTCLEVVREVFPDAQIIYKIGNHEERYERYMKIKAPEIYGVEEFELAKLIHADKYGIDLVGDKRILKIGRLNVIHGHEFWRSFSSPVNPARGLYLKGKESAICAHFHQTSEHTEKSMTDKVISCWSIGCCCDLHPSYSPINKWNYGFAVVERQDREFHVDNMKIIDGKIY